MRQLLRAYANRQWRTVSLILKKYNINPKHSGHLARAFRDAVGLDQQAAAAAFGSFRALSEFSPQFASNFTSVGTCTVTNGPISGNTSQARSKSLDAGSSLTLQGPAGQRVMQRYQNGRYQVALGSGYANASVPAGAYGISGTGGATVGPFTASLNIASSVTWTNKSAIATVDRSRPLTVTWSGGPTPGYLLIGGSVHTTGMNTAFLCVEDSTRGTFTIPSFVLSALPAADKENIYLFIGPHPFTHPILIPGVDLAYYADGSSDYTSVALR